VDFRARAEASRVQSPWGLPRDVHPARRVRGGRHAARLVGLVRGVRERPREREHAGRGRRGRRALHGRRQARRRLGM